MNAKSRVAKSAMIGARPASEGARRASSTGHVTGAGGVIRVPCSIQPMSENDFVWHHPEVAGRRDAQMRRLHAIHHAIDPDGNPHAIRAHATVRRWHAGQDRHVVRPRDRRIRNLRDRRDAARTQLVEKR